MIVNSNNAITRKTLGYMIMVSHMYKRQLIYDAIQIATAARAACLPEPYKVPVYHLFPTCERSGTPTTAIRMRTAARHSQPTSSVPLDVTVLVTRCAVPCRAQFSCGQRG